jgi:hypothetical protein
MPCSIGSDATSPRTARRVASTRGSKRRRRICYFVAWRPTGRDAKTRRLTTPALLWIGWYAAPARRRGT